jgi:hypothetical protein
VSGHDDETAVGLHVQEIHLRVDQLHHEEALPSRVLVFCISELLRRNGFRPLELLIGGATALSEEHVLDDVGTLQLRGQPVGAAFLPLCNLSPLLLLL